MAASKNPVLMSHRLAYAVDGLSKNTLADLVVDRARAELGEDATDEHVATLLEGWIKPVEFARGQHPTSLFGRFVKFDRIVENQRIRAENYPHAADFKS